MTVDELIIKHYYYIYADNGEVIIFRYRQITGTARRVLWASEGYYVNKRKKIIPEWAITYTSNILTLREATADEVYDYVKFRDNIPDVVRKKSSLFK